MKSGKLTLGLIASSFKENERRAAIHPAHFCRIPESARPYVYAERGFGKHFRVRDEVFEPHVAGLMEREELFEKCDAVMIFKPSAGDFPFFREGQVLWGAVHTVQNEDIVEVGLEKKMTFIAMEDMHLWGPNGEKGTWLFHTQSELAGYCSTLHAMQLLGIKGWHDQPRKVAIISFGSVGRGALQALTAFDFTDVTVFTGRPPVAVQFVPPTVAKGQYFRKEAGSSEVLVRTSAGEVLPFGEHLAEYDIIVNGVRQDTNRPLMFADHEHMERFKPGSLVVDVSCDSGMGFAVARPTTFDDPIFETERGVVYYAVDHSPSYLYNTAALEHSRDCVPYVEDVVGGMEAWESCPTVKNAIEILDGEILFRDIITFQNREETYPHRKKG